MTDSPRYRFLVLLEEVLGIALSNEESATASTTSGLANLLVAKLREQGAVERMAEAQAFVALRANVIEVFGVDPDIIRPSTLWSSLLPECLEARQQFWKRLRAKTGSRLPRLKPPTWPLVFVAVATVLFSPLLYAVLGTAKAVLADLAVLLVGGGLASGLAHVLAERPPDSTVGDTAKRLVEARGSGPDETAQLSAMADCIVRQVVAADLGRSIHGAIPFSELHSVRQRS